MFCPITIFVHHIHTRARALVQKSGMLQKSSGLSLFFPFKVQFLGIIYNFLTSLYATNADATDIIPIRPLPPKVKPLKDKRFKFAASDW